MPGSRPGERRGGRQKGTRNKSTAEIKAIALKYCPRALERLAELMESKDDKAATAAVREMLDRGMGKAPQPLTGDAEGDPIRVDAELSDRDLARRIAMILGQAGKG